MHTCSREVSCVGHLQSIFSPFPTIPVCQFCSIIMIFTPSIFTCLMSIDGGYIKDPPSTDFILSNLAHYPRLKSRNPSVPWDLQTSVAGLLAFQQWVYIYNLPGLPSWGMLPKKLFVQAMIPICNIPHLSAGKYHLK
jgi:hypothetical protein